VTYENYFLKNNNTRLVICAAHICSMHC